ncbi:hypothetical protein THOD04_10226 [Vibrio owensii]|nr:hypothetical protein THOD04_10226 [Vibrio owensii]
MFLRLSFTRHKTVNRHGDNKKSGKKSFCQKYLPLADEFIIKNSKTEVNNKFTISSF